MPKASHTRVVPFAAEKVFQAVLDIKAYPRILPFIRSVQIIARSEASLVARVSVGLPLLRFSYDCRIDYTASESIHVTLLSGPFKKLSARWQFTPESADSCRVAYELDSEFSNPIMEKTAGMIFASQIHDSLTRFEASLKR